MTEKMGIEEYVFPTLVVVVVVVVPYTYYILLLPPPRKLTPMQRAVQIFVLRNHFSTVWLRPSALYDFKTLDFFSICFF